MACDISLDAFVPNPMAKTEKSDFLSTEVVYDPESDKQEKFHCLLKENASDKPSFTKSSLYLSIVIPAMNEEERLPIMLDECLEYLKSRQREHPDFTYEVIIVDDGSSDKTAELGVKYGKNNEGNVKVLKLSANRGKGGAVRVGVLHSRGQLILFADADGATRFADINLLENEISRMSGGVPIDETFPGIAVGSRAHLVAESRATRSLPRTVLMHGFHLLVWMFAVRSVRDTQCGFKLFTRAAVAKLFPVLHIERWAFDVELIYLCEKWNLPIAEVAVTWHEVDGSKITPIWSWLQMGRDLVLVWFRYRVGIWNDDNMVSKRKSRQSDGTGISTDRKIKEDVIFPDEIKLEEENILNTYDEASDYAVRSSQLFDISTFCENIKIDIVQESSDGMELDFDLINVEAPIANALRRVLLAEVPTMAIEKVYLYQNTSVIQDEVLCHRIGLLPLKVDPRLFEFPLEKVIGINEHGVDCDEEPQPDPQKNIVFNINVMCSKNRSAPTTATDPQQLFHNSSIYSRSFEWKPCGNQATLFSSDPPRMVHDDILLAKLRPGQQIEASCHAVKGIGRDHAKFSPVATASYRLLPTIRLVGEIRGEAAIRLRDSFSEGVIQIKVKNAHAKLGCCSTGEHVAEVKDARNDTCSRNIFRHEDLVPLVQLGKKKDHFIFRVESTGALRSADLVVEACKVSKPIADLVIRYGKDHPVFRNKILIPIGRGLVRMTTRLRMKRLGLGEPTTLAQVSEAAALEQASDFVQQLVLFTYSLGVFSSYYFYTKLTSPDILKQDEFNKFKEENEKIVEELYLRVGKLEKALHISKAQPSSNVETSTVLTTHLSTSSDKPRFDRISSIPIDSAAHVVLKDGSEFLVMRAGSSIGIEEASVFRQKGSPLIFRKKELLLEPSRTGLVGCAEKIVLKLLGRWAG
uniref:DNA-directed RNA polymerases I and III subunit RPAC1 n=1 Tax=Heterorhabditis bacteriophora TaxID=37862 RepID=A0A1I7XNE7_HETBA